MLALPGEDDVLEQSLETLMLCEVTDLEFFWHKNHACFPQLKYFLDTNAQENTPNNWEVQNLSTSGIMSPRSGI